MSTYYFIVCDDCKEVTDAVSQMLRKSRPNIRGYDHLIDSDETLLPFIIIHSEHRTRIVSEHSNDPYSGEYLRWTKDNMEGLIWEAQRDGRWDSGKQGKIHEQRRR